MSRVRNDRVIFRLFDDGDVQRDADGQQNEKDKSRAFQNRIFRRRQLAFGRSAMRNENSSNGWNDLAETGTLGHEVSKIKKQNLHRLECTFP